MKFLIAVQCFLLLAICDARPSTHGCHGKALDMVFVLDTSDSVSALEFNQYVRQFVRNVVSAFDIGAGPDHTRIGVVTYSNEYHPQIDLGDNFNKYSLDRAIDHLVFKGKSTFTNKVLDYVAKDMFSVARGARSMAARVIVLVTDARSKFPDRTAEETRNARGKGISIFAVGVGEGIDQQELRDISSGPEFLFQVKDTKDLDGLAQVIVARSCRVLPPSNVISVLDTPLRDSNIVDFCGGKPADIYFLLDVSSSVWVKNFNTKVLPFVRDMISVFDIGEDKSRVGLATFSHNVTSVFTLGRHTSREQLTATIVPEIVRYTGGRTFTSTAIAFVRDYGFSSRFARKGVAQVLILITDGISYEPVLTASEAAKTKARGIYIFSVGVGPNVDVQELKDISSDPDGKFVFKVSDFTALSSVRDVLAIETCKVKPHGLLADSNRCNLDPTDFYFIFESFSKSISIRPNFRKSIIHFIKGTVMNTNGSQISAITDPCLAESSIPFETLVDFKLKFESVPVSARTKLHYLINSARSEVIKSRTNSLRSKVKSQKVVGVVFVDETTSDLGRVIMEARRARAAGVELFVVAIGNVPSRIIDMIGSSPAREHVILLDSYSKIDDLSEKLRNKMC